MGKKMLTKSPPKHLHCGVPFLPDRLLACRSSTRSSGKKSHKSFSCALSQNESRVEQADPKPGQPEHCEDRETRQTDGAYSWDCLSSTWVLSNSLKGRRSGESTLLPVTITTIYLLLTSRSFFIMQFVCVVLFKHGSRVIRMPSAKAKCIPKEQV